MPVFSPDGETVFFGTTLFGGYSIAAVPADGSAAPALFLDTGGIYTTPVSFSPNGDYLAYLLRPPEANADIWLLPLTGERAPLQITSSPADEAGGAISPDGRWLAYSAPGTAGPQIHLVSMETPRRAFQITTTGGLGPRWNPRGGELFYWRDSALMSVSVGTSGQAPAVGEHVVLFERDDLQIAAGENTNYDVAPDGERFLMLRTVDPGPEADQIQIVQNFFAELERLVPGGR